MSEEALSSDASVRSKKISTLTKAELIESIYEKIGFSKQEASDIVELVFDLLKTTLEKGEKVKISGFGNFVVREKRPRIGRNPQTGREINIPAANVPSFKPGKGLKDAVA